MASRRSRPRTVTLDDPRAIRALAHEVRQRVIEELYNGAVLTATEAAELCGVTPSAMSYHLRALARWGIVERAEASADGRQRPWRAAADQLNVVPGVSAAAGPVAAQAFLATYLQAVHRSVEHWGGRAAGARDHSAQLTRGRLWLDDDEASSLNREISAVVARYDDRSARDHPEGSTARDFFWMNVPHEDT